MKHEELSRAVLDTHRVDTHGHFAGEIRPLSELAFPPDALDSMTSPFNARSLAAGCEALYGIPVGPVLRTDAPPAIFTRSAALRALGKDAVYALAFDTAGIDAQLCFCDWRGSDAAAKRAIAPHVRLLAYIDGAIIGAPEKGERYIESLERLHGPLPSLDDLLAALDRTVDAWPAIGVVGMKVSLAYYDHGLDIRTATPAEAARSFARRGDMSAEDQRIVRDFALLHAFDACRRHGLPVVIHTGFLAFGQAAITASNPALLEPVVVQKRFADLTFVLLHGGYPYTGETGFMAARRHNVVIDFTWLSWMAPARFRQALGEWLAVAPLNKFVWGSDSGTAPESIVGIDRISRREILMTLDQEIASGVLDLPRALRFVDLAYRETPRRVFRLTYPPNKGAG